MYLAKARHPQIPATLCHSYLDINVGESHKGLGSQARRNKVFWRFASHSAWTQLQTPHHWAPGPSCFPSSFISRRGIQIAFES